MTRFFSFFQNESVVCNPGVSFGFFGGYGLALGIAGILLFGMLWMTRVHVSGVRFWLSMGLILIGAVWNIVERVRFGCVRDGLDFFGWFVFNGADACIFFGAVLTLLNVYGFLEKKSYDKE